MFTKKVVKSFVVASCIAMAAVSSPSFAAGTGVAEASKASAAQPCWVLAWIAWATRGAMN